MYGWNWNGMFEWKKFLKFINLFLEKVNHLKCQEDPELGLRRSLPRWRKLLGD